MGDRVYPGDQRYRRWQAVCKFHVVYDHLGENLHRADGRLLSLPRLAKHRRCLRAGIGGRKHDLRQVGSERQCLGEANRRAATESDDTIGIARDELFHDTLSNLHRRMHDGIRREVNTEVAEDAHETCRSRRCMMRIGKNEGSLATRGKQLGGHLRDVAKSEKDARRQCRIWEAPQAVFAEAHARTFVARANSSIIDSRIANFWTLPVTVEGKLSTKRM